MSEIYWAQKAKTNMKQRAEQIYSQLALTYIGSRSE